VDQLSSSGSSFDNSEPYNSSSLPRSLLFGGLDLNPSKHTVQFDNIEMPPTNVEYIEASPNSFVPGPHPKHPYLLDSHPYENIDPKHEEYQPLLFEHPPQPQPRNLDQLWHSIPPHQRVAHRDSQDSDISSQQERYMRPVSPHPLARSEYSHGEYIPYERERVRRPIPLPPMTRSEYSHSEYISFKPERSRRPISPTTTVVSEHSQDFYNPYERERLRRLISLQHLGPLPDSRTYDPHAKLYERSDQRNYSRGHRNGYVDRLPLYGSSYGRSRQAEKTTQNQDYELSGNSRLRSQRYRNSTRRYHAPLNHQTSYQPMPYSSRARSRAPTEGRFLDTSPLGVGEIRLEEFFQDLLKASGSIRFPSYMVTSIEGNLLPPRWCILDELLFMLIGISDTPDFFKEKLNEQIIAACELEQIFQFLEAHKLKKDEIFSRDGLWDLSRVHELLYGEILTIVDYDSNYQASIYNKDINIRIMASHIFDSVRPPRILMCGCIWSNGLIALYRELIWTPNTG
jgi:hypothetical protein